jgi:hypothetical protein
MVPITLTIRTRIVFTTQNPLKYARKQQICKPREVKNPIRWPPIAGLIKTGGTEYQRGISKPSTVMERRTAFRWGLGLFLALANMVEVSAAEALPTTGNSYTYTHGPGPNPPPRFFRLFCP